MTIDDILVSYVNRDTGHKREIGRYWASDVHSIKEGYLTPENFLLKKAIDLSGARMILTGVAFENLWTEICKTTGVACSFQEKKELSINKDITLVVKPDYVYDNVIHETKYPFSIVREEIPDRYLDQLECEYRAFYKQVYLGVFSTPFNLKLLPYTPSKRRWTNITNTLIDFHNKVVEINKCYTKEVQK